MGKVLSPIVTYLLVILFITIPDFSVSYEWELGIAVYIFVLLWLAKGFYERNTDVNCKIQIPVFSLAIVILIVWLKMYLGSSLIDLTPTQSGYPTALDEVRKSNGLLIAKMPSWTFLIIFPILEELTYREILIGQFKNRISTVLLVLLSSLSFAVAHVPAEYLLSFSFVNMKSTIIIYFFSGLVSSVIYLRFGLLASIFAHCYQNTLIYLLKDREAVLYFMGLSLLVVFVELIYRFGKLVRRKIFVG